MSRIVLAALLSVLIAGLPGLASAQEPTDPYTAYRQTMEKAQSDYRKAFGASLSKATRIEVLLLDFKVERYEGWTEGAWEYELPKDKFPITPYKSVTRILKSRVLTAVEMKKLLPALQATVGVETDAGGAMCHFPIHGLRVWQDDRLIFHTSFCWMCSTFYLEYPDFTVHWTGIQGTKLKDAMLELMPIPPAELERFKKDKNLPAGLKLN
jgi:hypothetical protein